MSTEADGETATEGAPAQPFGANMMRDGDRPPPGMTWRDHLVNHLRVAAAVEHALMVQYLFAAYSLNPEAGEDSAERSMIVGWQNLLLAIAKEEMGHLLTVQNALCLLGAPVDLIRDHQFPEHNYTSGFKLERLTINSILRYGWTEMPSEEIPEGVIPKNMRDLLGRVLRFLKGVRDFPKPPRGTLHVGALYRDIIEIISDPARIPDSAFREDSFEYQASWDDWGRGYSMKTITHETADLATMAESMKELIDNPRRADVIVDRMASRTQAKAALNRIFEQGEAARSVFVSSHFQRFSVIYSEFDRIKREKQKSKKTWQPTYEIVEDPHTVPSSGKPQSSLITAHRSKKWADLFDLRYSMLLNYLSHTFKLARNGGDARLRGAVIHKVFAEMYNLKAIAGILVQLPLNDDPDDKRRAGPPFSIPASLELPTEAIVRWQRHRDLIRKALDLGSGLSTDLNSALSDSAGTRDEEIAYVRTLQGLDRETENWINQVIAGLSPGKRPAA